MLTWLAHWNNWPFVVSLLVGLGLVGMTLLGVAKDLDHGGVDLNHDGIPDVSKPESDSFVFAALGAGKAPLSVLIEVLLVSFGLIGLLVNAVAHDLLAEWGSIVFPVSLALAVAGSISVTRQVADLIARFAPTDIPTSRRIGEYVGSPGVASSSITRTIGQVRIESPSRTTPDVIVNACVDPDCLMDDIARGTEVLVTSYDRTSGIYLVRPLLTS
jgi:hypothetical protein